MLIDTRELPSGSTQHFDLCIIGAGAAGISLAREFAGKGFTVGLLESGGFQPDEAQSLYQGETEGAIPASLRYLLNSRVRRFGGTTNVWTGWCRPLDALDFEKRDWVDHSGWPIRRRDLDSYYIRAARLCQVDGFDHEVDTAAETGSLLKQGSPLIEKRFHFSPPTRFGQIYRKELTESPSISVLIHANALELSLNPAGTSMTSIECATLSRVRFKVQARTFILACGGVENARLMLSSRSVQNQGVGNEHGLVGRFFMDHPHVARADGLFLSADSRLAPYLRKHHAPPFEREVRTVLAPAETLQKTRKMLNFSVVLQKNPDIPIPERKSILRMLRLEAPNEGQASSISVQIRTEQSPHPENRVTLSAQTDRFGKNLSALRWSLHEIDTLTLEEAHKIFATETGISGSGRIQGRTGDFKTAAALDSRPDAGSLRLWHHHMGTTRMHSSPSGGVVDSECKVHGIANLYIAGSSVFPTSGFANPTLTIVALAIRLADHLKSKGTAS